MSAACLLLYTDQAKYAAYIRYGIDMIKYMRTFFPQILHLKTKNTPVSGHLGHIELSLLLKKGR
jgi:hypothetical protein